MLATETRTTPLTCDTLRPDGTRCGQVLARIGERGSLYPVIIGAHVDCEGRLVVKCPSCDEQKRLPIRRRG